MKSHKKIFLFTILNSDNQRPQLQTVNSVNTSYLPINKLDRYIEQSNENKYLMLIFTEEG